MGKKGRPRVVTGSVVSLLVACFHNGLTVRQACWQSGISHEAYYRTLKIDSVFADKMNKAQQIPSITARTNIMSAIKKGDISASKWLLERKDKEEFSSKHDVVMQSEIDMASEAITEVMSEALTTLDSLIVYRYKLHKHALINNYCVEQGIDKNGPLKALYDLSNDELLRLAHRDMEGGQYDTPQVVGVFTVEESIPSAD